MQKAERLFASRRATLWHSLATLQARWSAPVFPLKAADFIKRGRGSLDRGGVSGRCGSARQDR
jgi:hypothetical protein